MNTIKDMPQDGIWRSLIVARTVTNWWTKTKSDLVQIGSPSDRSITIQLKTIVNTLSPVTAIYKNVVASAGASNYLETHKLE